MRKVTVAATQMTCSWDRLTILNKAEKIVVEAADQGANIILLQELFETPYFCQIQSLEYMGIATTLNENPAIKRMRKLAEKLNVVLPVSFFERYGNIGFNTIAIIDAGGEILGFYRKTHIPDGLPYAEKFYFTPGDTGFKVWNTRFGTIGVGICWDQWFPEAARIMALMGAEILFYPTAIGSEIMSEKDSRIHWQNVMRGHAAANMMPVVASNRIGTEVEPGSKMIFYGNSFISDQHGEIVSNMNTDTEGFVTSEFDLDALAKERREWGIFRDRRPETYERILHH
jgi:N-carbamoylputrescine amidase